MKTCPFLIKPPTIPKNASTMPLSLGTMGIYGLGSYGKWRFEIRKSYRVLKFTNCDQLSMICVLV